MKDTYMCVGSDFINSDGERETTIQLVDRVRGSIAIAWYRDNCCYKDMSIDSVDRTKFLDEAKELLYKSIPVQFKH